MAKRKRALFKCGRCRKGFSNPLGHVCTEGGGFKKLMAAEKKSQAAARRRASQHPYENCEVEDCGRIPCRAWREGFETGTAGGYASGYAAGQAVGYAEGCSDGAAAASAEAGS